MVDNVKYDRVRYSLYHISVGQVFIDEPIGFNDDDLEYARNSVYSGVFTLFSNNLEFYGNARVVIENIYQEYGEEAKVILKKETLQGSLWEEEYSGYLDFNTYVYGLKKSTCKFNSGGLVTLFKTQEDIEVEIERENALNGNSISGITVNRFNIQKRDVLVINQSVINGTQVLDNVSVEQCPLTNVVSSQNDDFSDVNDNVFTANANNFFWNQNSEASTDLRIDFDIEASSVRDTFKGQNIPFYSAFELHRYNWNGSSYDFIEKYVVGELDKSGDYLSILNTIDVSLNLNDSLVLKYINEGAIATIRKFDLIVSDVTEYTTTDNVRNFVFVNDLLSQLTSIITGKENKFKSDYFSNGEGSLIGFTSGLWIRRFVKGTQRYKSPTISWKNIISSLDATFNVGFGIEKDGVKDIVVVEDKKYFFTEYVAYKLPNTVSDYTREVNNEMLFSELEFGSSKSGKYEEGMGLDEPNVKNKYTTAVKSNKKTYTKVSSVRSDSYGKEFARRKPQYDFPSEDTKYDDSNWFLDIKDNTTNYSEKIWSDRFEELPIGVYSPETLTGAYFSPANCLLRHSWYFSVGLEKKLDDFVRFSSSSGNSSLVTKLIGGNSLEESGDILNYNLDKARFLPATYRFTHNVTKEIRDALKGNVNINGSKTPNVNCLWEFTNEDGETLKGFIKSVKPNSGEWELIPLNEQTRRGSASDLEVYGEANVYTTTFISTTIIDANANVAPIIGVLSYVSSTENQIAVSWTAATDTNLSGYKVYYKLSSAIDWIEFSDVGSGVTTETITGLSEITSYDISLIAYDTGALESERSNIVVRTTKDVTPPVIGVLSKGVQTDVTFPLSWTDATDNVAVTGYKVHYKETSSGVWTTIDTSSTDLNYTVTGLTQDTSYDFKITAYDAELNESTDSNIVTDKTTITGVSWYSSASSNGNLFDVDACNDSQPNTYWHTEVLLSVGDLIYTSNSFSSLLNGNNRWYKIGSNVFRIDSFGEIIDDYSCVT